MGLGLLQGLWLVLLGALGASSLVARQEAGRKALAALEPYQGWIGVASVAWGVLRLLQLLVTVRYRLWIVGVLVCGLFLGLGLVLGVGILESFLKDPQGRANFDSLVQKLTPYRQTLGVVAMVVGGLAVLGLF